MDQSFLTSVDSVFCIIASYGYGCTDDTEFSYEHEMWGQVECPCIYPAGMIYMWKIFLGQGQRTRTDEIINISSLHGFLLSVLTYTNYYIELLRVSFEISKTIKNCIYRTPQFHAI